MVSPHGSAQSISTGLEDLDEVLGGLLPGDNVVWISSQGELLTEVERRMLSVAGSSAGLYVSAERSAKELRKELGLDLTVLEARRGSRLSDAAQLEEAIVNSAREGVTRIVIDGLDDLRSRWGAGRAVGFFSRVCPRLFDLGAIAYWRASRTGLGSSAIDDIRKVTQCVFEVSGGRLRIVKAEGRPASVQGRIFQLTRDDGELRLLAEKALGRLAEGLRRVREERHFSQADLARLAAVSPSAISQAEAGHRGLSLDTLLGLSTELGVGLDDLLENEPRQDYVLARRDRGPDLGASRLLLDDPAAGLRAFLANVPAGARGAPPVKHKGPEMVLVARGLFLVDLGVSTPAVRAGDAVLATKVPILGWRNLAPHPSVLFWIVRD